MLYLTQKGQKVALLGLFFGIIMGISACAPKNSEKNTDMPSISEKTPLQTEKTEENAVKMTENAKNTENEAEKAENTLKKPQELRNDMEMQLGEQIFTITIAKTPAETQKGLMWRENLPENHGMLFVFPKSGVYSFYMKNTLIPLDMIWLENGEIVEKTTMQPCTTPKCDVYTPKNAANMVLEVNAGTFTGKIGEKAVLLEKKS